MNLKWLILSFLLLGFVPLVPKAWSENPQKVYLKASAETLEKFLAANSLMAAEQKSPKEVCPGMVLNFSPGQEAIIRLGNRLGCKVMWTQFYGTVEEFITYPSGKTERRVISPDTREFRYAELPSSIRVKAVTEASLRFMAQKPDQVQPPQAQSQLQSNPSLPSRFVLALNNLMFIIGNFLTMVFSVMVGFGVIYTITRFTQSSSTSVDFHWATLIENLQASPKSFMRRLKRQLSNGRYRISLTAA